MYSKVSSYQVKRWLDKNWDEQKELEKYITTLNIDWSKGWLMIDDTVIKNLFQKQINVYTGNIQVKTQILLQKYR